MTPYLVLRSAPITERTGEVTQTPDGDIRWHRVVRWIEVGTIHAKSEQQAYRLARETYGGRPVIEEMHEPIHYVG